MSPDQGKGVARDHHERTRRKNRRVSWAVFRESIPLVVGFVLAFIVAASILVFVTGGLRIGGGERTAYEQAELLSSGDCAVRRGQPVGRIVGTLTPSRGMHETRYQVQAIHEKKVLQVFAEEVQVVSCASLTHGD